MKADEVFDKHRANMRRRGLLPATIRKRFEVLALWQRWCVTHGRPLLHADEGDVQAWLDSRRLVDKTRHCYLSHLGSFYRWAAAEGHAPGDPTARIVRPRLRRRLPRPVSDNDLALAIRRADPRMRAILCLMAYGGLRCIEVSNLDVEDVLEADGVMRVRGKGDHERMVPIHPEVHAALRSWGVPRSGALFRSKVTGERLSPARVSHHVSEFLHGEGLPVTAHQLRHWFGTKMTEQAGLRVAQELMGHADPATTAIYAKVSVQQLKAAIGSLEAVEGTDVA